MSSVSHPPELSTRARPGGDGAEYTHAAPRREPAAAPRWYLLEADESRSLGRDELDHLPQEAAPPGRVRVAVEEVPLRTSIATGVAYGRMRVVLADPPAFTPAYDHELAAALARAGADVELVTSHFRFGHSPSRTATCGGSSSIRCRRGFPAVAAQASAEGAEHPFGLVAR